LVSGWPAAGKTTLAHAIGSRLPCPVVSLDEIKEGLVHAGGGGTPDWGAPVAYETFALFYRVVGELVRSGCSVVAEATYRKDLSQEVTELLAEADGCIVHCQVDRDEAMQRFIKRAASDRSGRESHPDTDIAAAMQSGDSSGRATSQWSWGFGCCTFTQPTVITPRLTTWSPSAVLDDEREPRTRRSEAFSLAARNGAAWSHR
jgi:predicted kinase